jgi:hypothetical protein
MGFEPNTRIFSRVLNSKKFKSASKRLALFHMKEAHFSALNFKPGYLEHTNLDFRSEKCVTKLRPGIHKELIIVQNFSSSDINFFY